MKQEEIRRTNELKKLLIRLKILPKEVNRKMVPYEYDWDDIWERIYAQEGALEVFDIEETK